MANRICPLCLGKVPRAAVLARSSAVGCPHCQRALELSLPSRLLASLLGLLGAYAAFRYTSGQGPLGWVLPLVASVLAFGIASALLLLLNADLVVRQEDRPEALASPGQH